MIDLKKPLQLSDGTPVVLYCDTDAIGVFGHKLSGFRAFNRDGSRPMGPGLDIRIQNVPETPSLDLTKPIQTRDGRKARLLASDVQGMAGTRLVVAIQTRSGSEVVKTRRLDGRMSSGLRDYHGDIINVPEETVTFHNVYAGSELSSYETGLAYDSAVLANFGSGFASLGILKVAKVDGKLSKMELVNAR